MCIFCFDTVLTDDKIGNRKKKTKIPPMMSLHSGGNNVLPWHCYTDPHFSSYYVTENAEGDKG